MPFWLVEDFLSVCLYKKKIPQKGYFLKRFFCKFCNMVIEDTKIELLDDELIKIACSCHVCIIVCSEINNNLIVCPNCDKLYNISNKNKG